MKVLLWSDSYPPYHGGLERATEMLACGLADRQHEVSVLTSHHGGSLPDLERSGGVAIYRLPLYSALETADPKRIAMSLARVASLKRTLRPDLVHLQLQTPTSFFHLQTTGAWSCPSVATIHGEFKDCQAGDGTLLGELFHRVVWVTAVSHALLSDLRSIAPGTTRKSSCIYNGVEPAASQRAAANPEQPIILGCGRHVPEKGFDILMTAFHRLADDVPGARLVITGDGPERARLQQYAEDVGIAHRVSLPGWVSDEELFQQMEEATIMVMPSRWREGFGLVAIEAAMRGVPVIAATVGALPELIEDRKTGLLVPPDNPAALRHAMLELLRQPGLGVELGSAARISALQRFSKEAMLDQYERLYSSLFPVPVGFLAGTESSVDEAVS